MAVLITLLTDFAHQDSYVGVMKGVIAGICPAAQIIDLTHGIPPQNIAAARFALLSAHSYFPLGTIHTVVVDPGVGTNRRAIAIQTPTSCLVGPDNGVFSGVLDEVGATVAIELTNADYWLTATPSTTFHGRDIFAPIAAHIAAGVSLSALGTEIAPESLCRTAIPKPTITDTAVIGHVQHIDHFGNAITTLPADVAVSASACWGKVGTTELPLSSTYGDVEIGQALALIGSHGWVEIAVNGASAEQHFHLTVGDEVQLIKHHPA